MDSNHETADGLNAAGARDREGTSQAVFTRHLNVT
jgi:hypothetical protein